MKISVFGMGYVGVVTAACLARDGHQVIGVDVNSEKIARINQGKSPIVEPGLAELLKEGVNRGLVEATSDAKDAVLRSDMSLISVGTPPNEKGIPELKYVFQVCREIGSALTQKKEPHVVVLRSTVPPGTLDRCSSLFKEVSEDCDVHLAFNPEFLREASAIKDYDNPPYTVIGTDDALAEESLRKMYATVPAPIFVTPPAVAEMVKYVSNAWHAAKISFANEVGRISKGYGVDGRDVMGLVVQDTKLNISPTYMRPGFAYGGSCLPKDVSALLCAAREMNIAVPMLDSLPVSNAAHIEKAVQEVLNLGVRKVALLGLAFKPKTDDLRESPAVVMAKRLIGEGCEIKIYDQAVHQAWLVGTNLAYIQNNIPHFEALLVPNVEDAVEDAELIIVTHATDDFRNAVLKFADNKKVLDLAGVFATSIEELDHYGIAW
ncbi:MAG: UDP-glucose/GDP-mannose dehydrogenase family protein [Leptolyngbyaceae bacterium]|nr:UDP-glucose/GDP-mannose dehydrogenase family protein [Leptolyngbyaceae bacterium]